MGAIAAAWGIRVEMPKGIEDEFCKTTTYLEDKEFPAQEEDVKSETSKSSSVHDPTGLTPDQVNEKRELLKAEFANAHDCYMQLLEEGEQLAKRIHEDS